MEIAWGTPLKTQIQGLDILGLRGLDQGLEEKLVKQRIDLQHHREHEFLADPDDPTWQKKRKQAADLGAR